MTDGALLRTTDVCKAYDGVQALDHASLELRAGEVHALVGENGAGKSTLVKILTGAVQPDAGALVLDGQLVRHRSPRAARELGIVAIYQQPALFPALTVAENIALGVERTAWWRRVDWPARRRRAAALLAGIGARIDPDADAATLSMPEQQLVEIARALGADARVLVLDEPTASLGDDDARHLFDVVRRLRARGVGLLYISHRLEELTTLADRVTVLRDGRTIATRAMADVSREELIRLMVGRELAATSATAQRVPGEVVLELHGLGCRATGVHDVDLTLRAGEIVGVAGLVGAGRTELARVLFGLTAADAGEIRLDGRALTIADPATAIAHGIAYVPEDRRHHGVVPELDVAANVTLAALDRLTRHGAVDRRRERALALEYVRRLAIRTPSIFTPVAALSGGNQQKVALSRWMITHPRLLVLDEPTQGVDVGAKSEIHALVRELAARGVAILMISSELPEVLALSDRVAVMRDRTIVALLDRADATQERVLAAALGAEAHAA